MAVSSALLIAPLVAVDGLALVPGLAIIIAVPITSALATFAIKALDHESIVSLRRVFGLTMTSNLLWIIPFYVGSLLSSVRHENNFSLNEFTLGAFLAWSLQLLVINGAFISSTAESLCIAAIQPITVLLLALTLVPIHTTVFAAALGLIVLGITFTFLIKFKTFKTEGAGINSLQTFQSFLKSWVSQRPADLEGYFTMYSHNEPVTTNVVMVAGADRAAVVLPGVHPGPFFPVGSYNISELIFHSLLQEGVTPIVLHGVGGHERNLPTNELAKRYAATIADAVKSPGGEATERIRGPSRLQIGPTTVTTLEFRNNVIAFLSNAPYNTDDLEPRVIDEAVSAARELGIELMLVDAHNSIGGQNCEQPILDWRRIFSDIRAKPEEEFDFGVANSSELRFEHGSDISDGGVTALVIRKHGSKYALISSDSNNAAFGLRQTVKEELEKDGVELIELCTSDTHSSAARNLSSRGYSALGEDSDREALLLTIKRLEKLAEAKLSHGNITAVTSHTTLPLIGDKSLNDFAALTRDALGFAKTYAAAAVASIVVICSLALL